MPRVNERFGEEVQRVLKEHGWSYRRATIATGVDYGTVGNMAMGMVPRKGVVIDWAIGIKEDVNRWLELADYESLPPQPLPVETVDEIIDRIREENKDKPEFKEEDLDVIRRVIIQETQPKKDRCR